jgi:SAM-dependent methyltransferase
MNGARGLPLLAHGCSFRVWAPHAEQVWVTQVVLDVHGHDRRDMPRYDAIGQGYARFRREDPGFRARIHAALGSARSVVNVGAGAGSYEPRAPQVIAIEPSAVMLAQRAPGAARLVRALAGQLPLRARSVDAAMCILSLHHWDDQRERGVRELRRVARGSVVIVTYDARVSGQMWLMQYLPEVAALDRAIFPDPERVAEWLGGEVSIEALPIPRDTPDWMLGSYWAHPERVLDPGARAATSGFARMPTSVVERVVQALGCDLADGTWERQYGWLRALDALDVGLRLIVAQP